MFKVLIIAQSRITSEALRAVVASRIGQDEVQFCSSRVVKIGYFKEASELFCELASWIDKEIELIRFPHDQTTVLVDSVKADFLNPIGAGVWDAAIGMLILAFPDVRWVFGVTYGGDKHWKQWHGLKAFLDGYFANPLFDGSGLRQWVLKQAKNDGGGRNAEGSLVPFIPIRKEWAAAIDDEVNYAFFNAYICYRFGFRCWAVNTNRLFEQLFDDQKSSNQSSASLTFEDLYLGLPDKDSKVHYSDLTDRDEHLPALKKVAHRFFVTTCHQHGVVHGLDPGRNGEVLRDIRETGHGGKILLKPIPGIFTLWHLAGLNQDLVSFDEDGHRRLGFASGFIWPPEPSSSMINVSPNGHSAPGRLLQISEFLIARAHYLWSTGVNSVPQSVCGAVMASLAQELLGDRTPSTARDCLELKHCFEVLAECKFGGVESNISVSPRLVEIESEMHKISEWYNDHRRIASWLNGQLQLLNRLSGIFNNHGELEEAEACRRRVRDLSRKLYANRTGWWTQPIVWLRWYIEKLIGSTKLLLIAIVGWFLLFFLINITVDTFAQHTIELADLINFHFWINILTESLKHLNGGDRLSSGNQVQTWGGLRSVISIIAASWGSLHVGILITHIYRLYSRS